MVVDANLARRAHGLFQHIALGRPKPRRAPGFALAAGAALLAAACATIEAPRIGLGLEGPVYISPANADGVQDAVQIPVDLIPDERGVVSGYAIRVVDQTGGTVYQFERAVDASRGLVASLLEDLRIRRRPGVAGPELVVWDGKDANGRFVVDGPYRLSIEAWDGKRRSSSLPVEVIVDNTPPTAELGAEFLLFSPSGDGRRDELPIRQIASEELRWVGTILNSRGASAAVFSWDGKPPELFSWNGLDSSMRRAPDGAYRYRLVGRDRAGNEASFELPGIALDTSSIPFFVGLSGRAFSPNGDGVRDVLYMQPVMERLDGTAGWSAAVVDSAGTVVWRADERAFRRMAWDGKLADGRPAPEGQYWVRMTVEFQNGNAPERLSDPITLDRTPPRAAVAKSHPAFSPDGDGRQDTIRFTVSGATREDEWLAQIETADGKRVRSASWQGLPEDFEWDGLDDEGFLAQNGRYVYKLFSIDEAGNEFVARTAAFSLDARPTPAELRLAASGFSPNGDGVKDSLRIDLYLPVREEMASWSLRIRDAAGRVIRSLEGRDEAPGFDSFVWDGLDDAGVRAPDGMYRAGFQARYLKGNEAAAESSAFVLDASPPALSLAFGPLPFSPDGDGQNDTVDINLTSRDISAVEDWEIVIRDREGNFFTSFSGRGAPSSPLRWNGLSRNGELAFSAEDYRVEATARDAYGNLGRSSAVLPVDILVIREGDRYRIRLPGIYFAPFSAEFPADKAAGNMATLRRLAEVLGRFPGYAIRVEGHAVRINWADRARGEAEEREVLAPLSRARAERVRQLLIGLGIDGARLSSAGLGGTAPFVPHSDFDNRWKNRRVDFVLIRR